MCRPIGNMLRMCRVNAGFSMREVADRLCVSHVDMGMVERGRKDVDYEFVCRYLHVIDRHYRSYSTHHSLSSVLTEVQEECCVQRTELCGVDWISAFHVPNWIVMVANRLRALDDASGFRGQCIKLAALVVNTICKLDEDNGD